MQQSGPSRSQEESEKNDGFKGDVGRKEVGDLGPHPYAQGEGNQKKGQQCSSLAHPGPRRSPRRMTVSKEMSAARKLGTLVRTHTPRVRGTRKKASNAAVWPIPVPGGVREE